MARKDNLIKSKSIYTISKKHMNSSEGTIYEHDHITILQNDGIYDDEMALFSDSNFKYRISKGNNQKKRHTRFKWATHDGPSGETWTRMNLSAHTQTEESYIESKPNYNSLKDFAYYGSATELIHATVNDIITRFPGGISFGNFYSPKIEIEGNTYYLVSNEFDIDCWSRGPIFSGDVKNPMRILAASYENYICGDGSICPIPVFTGNGSTCLNSIIGRVNVGKEELAVYKDSNGHNRLISTTFVSGSNEGVIIRPKQEIINRFWQTLDDFEKVLLDRKSNPVYKAVFETPFKNETGYYYTEKSYIWPTVNNDNFTPDVSSVFYQGYLSSLISLAEFYDTYDADNMWRMMTHESIKNLDWTFNRAADGETEDLSDIDSSRMKAMIHVYGRQFDDIKRAVDNIKVSNAVSYDEKNNTPDYFLSDLLENDGWEAQNITPVEYAKTDNIYSGACREGISTTEVGATFARRLALSSNYIQSLKGTRKGISTILNMFGYSETPEPTSSAGTFSISEYIAVATSGINYNEASHLRGFSGEYLYEGENTNLMLGYPVAVVDSNPEETAVSGGTLNYYLIPWFENGANYAQPIYFQSKGGWGKRDSKEISLPITSATTIEGGDGISLYEETLPYMKFAETIDAMLSISNSEIKENIVCYVTDISPLYESYSYGPDEEGHTDFSHYFILKNTALSQYVGFVRNDLYECFGWRNVFNSEIADVHPHGDGKRVVYLESLISEWKGNNPHTGYGNYDDGHEYLERYRHLFGAAIKEGVYDNIKNSEDDYYKEAFEDIKNCGFKTIEGIKDNTKCHFFGSDILEVDGDVDYMKLDDVESIYSGLSIVNICPTQKKNYDEGAADSVINVKKLRINFGTSGNTYLRKYIDNVVLKYLEPMIPSTAILEYTYDGKEVMFGTPSDSVYGIDRPRFTITAHAAVPESGATDNILYERDYNEEKV